MPAHDSQVLVGPVDDAVRAEWDALADRTGATPFLRPGWIEAWHRAFGLGALEVAVARRDGRVVGVMPVESRRGVLRSPTNWQTPLYGPVVEDADAAREVARATLGRARRRFDAWFLGRELAGLAEIEAEAQASGQRTLVRTIARSPYVPVEGSFEEFMSGLDRKFRKDIGRRWRRLEEQGAVTVTYEDGTTDLDAFLADGFRLEGSGWKTEAGTAILSSARTHSFYRDVAGWAAGRGWLRLAFLRVDDQALAFDLCLEADSVFYALKGGFDVEARKLGPGTLLTHHQIERAFEMGMTSYELLGRDDEYKRSWTDRTRERVRLQVFPRSPLGTLEGLAWRRGRPLAKRLQAAASGRPWSRSR